MPGPLPLHITIGDKYHPAMKITDQAEADAYFELCVEHCGQHLVLQGKATSAANARPQAETIERANLGYFAGYYDHQTRARVERLFRCAHPIFGAIEQDGPPSAEQALLAGLRAGIDSRER